MIRAIFRAVIQLPDPVFLRVMAKSLAAAVIVLGALIWFSVLALGQIQLTSIGWIDSFADWLGGAAAVVLGLILFPGTAVLIIGLFLDEIAAAVERRFYPDLPAPRRQPMGETAIAALRLLAATIVLNLLMLPLYLVPGLNLFVFYGLNGYLLGREYFEMVALRRLDHNAARVVRRHNRGRVFAAGVVVTVLLSIPVVNVFMPVIAMAFMVHVFEAMRPRFAAAEQGR